MFTIDIFKILCDRFPAGCAAWWDAVEKAANAASVGFWHLCQYLAEHPAERQTFINLCTAGDVQWAVDALIVDYQAANPR